MGGNGILMGCRFQFYSQVNQAGYTLPLQLQDLVSGRAAAVYEKGYQQRAHWAATHNKHLLDDIAAPHEYQDCLSRNPYTVLRRVVFRIPEFYEAVHM